MGARNLQQTQYTAVNTYINFTFYVVTFILVKQLQTLKTKHSWQIAHGDNPGF